MGGRSRVVVASLVTGLATLHGRDVAAQVTVGQVDTFESRWSSRCSGPAGWCRSRAT